MSTNLTQEISDKIKETIEALKEDPTNAKKSWDLSQELQRAIKTDYEYFRHIIKDAQAVQDWALNQTLTFTSVKIQKVGQ